MFCTVDDEEALKAEGTTAVEVALAVEGGALPVEEKAAFI